MVVNLLILICKRSLRLILRMVVKNQNRIAKISKVTAFHTTRLNLSARERLLGSESVDEVGDAASSTVKTPELARGFNPHFKTTL